MSKMLLCVLMILAIAAGTFAAEWDVRSDTWVATDALGRKLPGFKECGPPKKDKFVAIFYFLWLGQHGTGGPYDITKILAANPNDPQWGPPGAFHHWGESEVGYYLSSDEWVIRRHVRMLVDAGIDVLALDVTNSFTYPQNFLTLCKELQSACGGHDKGIKTPQVIFMANSASDQTVTKLYNDIYAKKLYPDLWFRWLGKPLILAAPGNLSAEIKDFFTFRQSWAWHDPNGWFGDGKDKWPWLDSTPQAFGWHEPGVPEEICVCVAQHPTTNIGRSHSNGKQPDPEHFQTDKGIYFAEQWKRALEVNPSFLFVTGWNEWVAQRFIAEGVHEMLMGRKLAKGDSFFVDAYNQEYSRDIEPMKGGHTDNYYYQMIDGIRRFKGVRAPEPSSGPAKIKIDGRFDDWKSVRPEFRDWIGDTEHRSSVGWGDAGTYVNKTGRNDFVRLKVAYDPSFVYFYAETRSAITSRMLPNWMLLFIDADCDSSTGWHGYDYLVNYKVTSPTTTTLMRTAGGWNWKQASTVSYHVAGNKMEIRIPRRELGLAGRKVALDFHWADNIQKPDDIIEFAVSGDSAPDRRFNYHFEQR